VSDLHPWIGREFSEGECQRLVLPLVLLVSVVEHGVARIAHYELVAYGGPDDRWYEYESDNPDAYDVAELLGWKDSRYTLDLLNDAPGPWQPEVLEAYRNAKAAKRYEERRVRNGSD
jgi:hypothetical protein